MNHTITVIERGSSVSFEAGDGVALVAHVTEHRDLVLMWIKGVGQLSADAPLLKRAADFARDRNLNLMNQARCLERA
jgi:hypothetical protein